MASRGWRLLGATAVLLAVSVGVAGCAGPPGSIKTDALRNPASRSAKTFRIVATNGPAAMNAPEFQDVARKLSGELDRRGLREEANLGNADWVIEIDFGVRAVHRRVGVVTLPPDPSDRILIPKPGGSGNRLSFVDATPHQSQIKVEEISEKYLVIVASETNPASARSRQAWRIESRAESADAELGTMLPRLLRDAVRNLDTVLGT